jgi:hypothetical protein
MSSATNNNSNNNIFPIMSETLTPEQLCTEGEANGILSTDWYTPVSVRQTRLQSSSIAHRN